MIFGESNFEIILNFNNKVHDLIYRNQYLILGILLLKFVANFKANGDGLNVPSSVDVGLLVMYKAIIVRIMILAMVSNIFFLMVLCYCFIVKVYLFYFIKVSSFIQITATGEYMKRSLPIGGYDFIYSVVRRFRLLKVSVSND